MYERKTADNAYKIYTEKFKGNSYAGLLYNEITKWDIDSISYMDYLNEPDDEEDEEPDFDDLEFNVEKSNGLTKFMCDGEIIGYGAALSTALILKSTEFSKVKTIIFDEFIINTNNIINVIAKDNNGIVFNISIPFSSKLTHASNIGNNVIPIPHKKLPMLTLLLAGTFNL